MAAKVTFDPTNKQIVCTVAPVSGVVSLNFKSDVYAGAKGDWFLTSSLTGLSFAVEPLGGQALPGGSKLDSTYFLKDPWKILPYDADHELQIIGNVFTETGTPVTVSRPGRTITVRLLTTFSADAVVTPSQLTDSVMTDGRALTVGKFIALK